MRMLAGLLVGTGLGVLAHVVAGQSPALEAVVHYVTEPVGALFLRSLFMLVIPLIVSALALGVAGLGDVGALGRIGLKTLVYTVVVSGIAVLLGVGLVNLVRPGDGLDPALKARLLAQHSSLPEVATRAGDTGLDFLVKLVPANPVRSMADGDMLGVMVFALFWGSASPSRARTPPVASRRRCRASTTS